MLEGATSPELRLANDVLLVHAHGELQEREKAQAAFDDLMSLPPFRLRGVEDLTTELHHRYLNGATPQHDDEWVFQREFDVLVAAL